MPLPALWAGVLLGAVILAAAVARLAGIGAASFWYDEILTVRAAEEPFPRIVDKVRRSENSPPLYFILINAWAKIAGISERSLRLPSAVIGVASVGLLYCILRPRFGQLVVLTATALLAVSSFHIAYSQEARTYALLMLLLMLCTWAFLALLERGSGAAQVAYVATATLAMYAHTFSAFAIAAFNLFYASRRLRRGATGVPLVRWLALQAAVVVLFGPWIPATREVAAMGLPWITRPAPFHEALAGYAGSTAGAVVAGILVLVALYRAWKERDDRILLFALLLIVPTVGPWLYGPFTVRYGIVAVFALAILCAYAAAGLGRVAAVALVALAAVSWVVTSDLGHARFPGYTQKRDVRAVARFMVRNATAYDAYTLNWAPLLAAPYEYYRHGMPPSVQLDGVPPTSDLPPWRIWLIATDPASPEPAIAASPYHVTARHAFDGVTLLELTPSPPTTTTSPAATQSNR